MKPGEKLDIPIKITSNSNARTIVVFEIIDSTEGWSPSINTEVSIGTSLLNEDNTETVYLQIQSPGGSGYHNDVGLFNMRVKTMAKGHPDAGIDNSTVISFNVRSEGTVNGENGDNSGITEDYINILIITIIISVLLLIFITYFKRRY